MPNLTYALESEFVDHWLVAGPHACPTDDSVSFEAVAAECAESVLEIVDMPVETRTFEYEGTTYRWIHRRAGEDGRVDLAGFYATPHVLKTWAYAELCLSATATVQFALSANGPATMWVDHHLAVQTPDSECETILTLGAGCHPILVRFEVLAFGDCPYGLSLQLHDLLPDSQLRLPTAAERTDRYERFERMFDMAHLDRDVFTAGDMIAPRWPGDMDSILRMRVLLQREGGQIFAESVTDASEVAGVMLPKGLQVPDGAYHIALLPRFEEYYEHDLRVRRDLSLRVLKGAYTHQMYGDDAGRQQEALQEAAQRGPHIFAEIAKIALGKLEISKPDVIEAACERVAVRANGSVIDLLGLLNIAYRDVELPGDLKARIAKCATNYRYWRGEPGSDALEIKPESRQILLHTCQVLAGQLYADVEFALSGQPGRWHRQTGEDRALGWLRQRSRAGFESGSDGFEEMVTALVHLIDWAESDDLAELAAVVLDKLLFTLALNSYQGVFVAPGSVSQTASLKNARLSATAGMSRLLWGQGVFNDSVAGVVSLASSSNYQIPTLIQAVAIDQPPEVLSREHQNGIDRVTYRTPDTMLNSAQDYRPGDVGMGEHIWQATFGPDALVFVNQPACASDHDAYISNFWRGNHTLPRVAQRRDSLIAIYRQSDAGWPGFTHAYFPIYAFDEYALRDGWAFARKGDGYVALTATHGLSLVTDGDHAYRELRSPGTENVWLCQMGRATQDGSFEAFQNRLLTLDCHLETLAVQWTTLRGDALAFGWRDPFLANGEAEPITGFKQYDSPYCVAEQGDTQMEIRFHDYAMRLDFGDETYVQST